MWMQVARMERSDIRGVSPHFASLNAGYERLDYEGVKQ
jgi:hypothetical protein